MLVRFPKMSTEGAPQGGGGAAAPALPDAGPHVVAPPVIPTATIAAEVQVGDLGPAPTAPTAAEPKPDAPDVSKLMADFEAYKAKTAELETRLATSTAESKKFAFEAAFDRAGVLPEALDEKGQPKGPQYRTFLRQQLGDIDPRSDAGKAAIDAIVAQNPAMKSAVVSTEDPFATYLRAKAEEARKAGGDTAMWNFIPPDMMRAAVGGLDKEGR